MTTEALLSVSDVAKLRACNRSTAWRLLMSLERDFGVKLMRDKKAVFISNEELREGVARMGPVKARQQMREIGTLRRRVSALEAWKNEADAQIRAMRKNLAERGL